jgi:hypothetical protein
MSTNENRRSGLAPDNGGDYDSSIGAKVISLLPKLNAGSPFQQLTARLILARHRNGTLDPAVLIALLAAVGLQP